LDDNKQKHKKFSNHLKGFQELTHWLKKFNIEALHACMEATNIYGNALAEYLYDNGYDVSIDVSTLFRTQDYVVCARLS
jgi:transposase